MNHAQLRDDIPLLALDALPPAERTGLEAHVSRCAPCAFELREYREVAAMLGLLSPPVQPPATTWRRIASGLGEDRMSDRLARRFPRAAEPVGRRWASRGHPHHRQRLVALGAAAVLVLGVTGAGLLRLSGPEPRGGQPPGPGDRAEAIARGPHRALPMRATAEARGAGGEILLARDGRAAVVMHRLPPRGDGTYVVWLIVDHHARPLGGVRPDASGAAVMVPTEVLSPNPTIAVTLEADAATPSPKGPTVLTSQPA